MALILTGSSGNATLDSSAGLTFSDSSNQSAAASPYVLKNRIINGDMRIDQRNAGASKTITSSTYTLDRFACEVAQSSKVSVQQNAGSVTPPTGFKNYLGVTSLSAYSVLTGDYFDINTSVEGFNWADVAWGTANAKTVTLSFWVYSSLTGTFGGSICNSAANRSYLFSYTISSANTWTQITLTIAGDTSGTWLTDNSAGCYIRFGLGCGSTYGTGTSGAWTGSNIVQPTGTTSVVGVNGATWYITGVQLEIGSTATPFERRLYGQELLLCQRYYQLVEGGPFGSVTSTVYYGGVVGFLVQMRATPTPTFIQCLSAYGFPTTTSTAIATTSRSFVIYKAANASLGGCYFQDQYSLSAEL